jgi:hypothetical protein
MTRDDLEADLYRDFGYATSPATAVTTRIRAYLNTRHRRLLGMPGLEKLRWQTQTFSTVASTPIYGLDMPIAKVLKLADTTNDQPLWQRGLDWYRTIEPDTSAASGTSQYWIDMGHSPALRDIGGTRLDVVSTSASDTTQTALVETINSVGSITSTTAALNGTTRVQIGTATNHQRLLRFAVSAAGVGEIELYDAAAAGNLVSQIEVGRTSAQFQQIALWPTPSAIVTIQIDFLHHIRDFTTAYTEPQLPLDFHWLVALGAKIDEARQKGSDARQKEWTPEYEQGIRDLLAFLTSSYDSLTVPGEADEPRRSNLSGTVGGTAGVIW